MASPLPHKRDANSLTWNNLTYSALNLLTQFFSVHERSTLELSLTPICKPQIVLVVREPDELGSKFATCSNLCLLPPDRVPSAPLPLPPAPMVQTRTPLSLECVAVIGEARSKRPLAEKWQSPSGS